MPTAEARFLPVGRVPSRLALCVLGLIAGAAGCARSMEANSGETHFLQRCSDDCAGGLQCVGTVCTRECKDAASCAGLGADASCERPPSTSADQSSARTCDLVCERDGDCAALGVSFSCEAGRCRSTPVVAQDAGSSVAADAGQGTPVLSCPGLSELQASDDGGFSCEGARYLLNCRMRGGGQTCLSDDPTQCPDSTGLACEQLCKPQEHAAACGGIGPNAPSAEAPARCHDAMPTPGGTVFYCCDC